jgi:hypothetical protein
VFGGVWLSAGMHVLSGDVKKCRKGVHKSHLFQIAKIPKNPCLRTNDEVKQHNKTGPEPPKSV